MRHSWLVIFAGSCLMLAAAGYADPPTTAPLADDAVAKQIRDTLFDWDKSGPSWSLEQVRKLLHTDNDREAMYADFLAHESWQETKTQEAVRRKWGPEVEAKFAHMCGSSTLEDDRSAIIKVDGDTAVLTWPIKELSVQHLLKIDGKWLVDVHSTFEAQLKQDPQADQHQVHTARTMSQAADDVVSGKYDDADSFLADMKDKLGLLGVGN